MSDIRLQRVLAQAGLASRRKAEELITAGRVRVDGKVAELGSKVDPARQAITVDGRRVRLEAPRWIVFHKPLGVVTTSRDEQGRRTVYDVLPAAKGLSYVGRLDVNTTAAGFPLVARVAATSNPSMSGSMTSRSTTSGRSERAASIAEAPSAASPTTSNPSLSSSTRAVLRNVGWSSTTRKVFTTWNGGRRCRSVR